MSKETELLERYYNTLINFENPKDFFYGLSDYIDFVKDTPEFDRILTDLLDQKKVIDNNLNDLELIAIKKLSEIHKELFDYISKNKIENNGIINEALSSYNSWTEGKTMGMSKPEGLYEELSDIIQCLYEKPEHKEFVSRFITFSKHKAYVRYYLYPEEYKEFFENLEEGKAKYKSELWGQMNEVIRHYQIIKKGREKRRELVKSAVEDKDFKATYELTTSHAFLLGEWTNIEEGKYDKLSFFKIEKFRPTINRFQNYILKELNKKIDPLQDLKDMENEMFGIKKSVDFANKQTRKETIKGFQQEIDITNKIVGEIKKQKTAQMKNQTPQIVKSENKDNDFASVKLANEKMAKQFLEKAEMKESIKKEVLAEIQDKNQKGKTDKVILSLSKQGKLCNERGRCYDMGEKSKRHKLIRFLTENQDYQGTRFITESIGYQNNQTTSGEIIKIRKNVKRDLNITGKDFLQSKKDSGYRINPRYKIKMKS